jgi:hypothetical protein
MRLGSTLPFAVLVSVSAFAFAAFAGSGCAELRRAEVETTPDASAPEEASVASDVHPVDLPLAAPDDPDLPKVTYRAVTAVAPDRVFIVGDETILEFLGTKWRYIPVGGVELHGVWADADDAWAVGFRKNTNTGVIMWRQKSTWVEFETVPHGLRAIYGSGQFRMATGNDGAVYYGTLPQPFLNGRQLDRPPDIPETLLSPILYGVAGNSPSKIAVAGGVGSLYRYLGDEDWAGAIDSTDRSRAYRCVFAAPGDKLDTIVGANYYGLWHYRGAYDVEGNRLPMSKLFEDRDSITASEQSITSIWGPSIERFIAVGTAGRFIDFEYAKGPKILTTPAGSRDLYGVSATSFDDVWVVGADGLILHGAVPPP